MILLPLRWLAKHIGSLLLAFVLAMIVWFSAVITADPNEERTYTRPITVIGQNPNLAYIGDLPTQTRIGLKAPRSILNQIANSPSSLQAWVDLSGLGAGEHAAPIQVSWNINPVRLVQKEPEAVQFTLEVIESRQFPVQLLIEGEAPLGYKKGSPTITPIEVTISGRKSLLDKISLVRAYLNVAGAGETVQANVILQAVDKDGNSVTEVNISPRTARVIQPVNLLGGYKNVVVKVVTEGKIANGYRLTNISVTPLNVTIFSDDPQLIDEMPGFIETQPLDLTGLAEDIEVRLELSLPKNISLVGEQSVLVQVSVASIESSMRIGLPVETVGLLPGYKATLSPSQVDVLISGPLPVLDTLTPASFRAVVDLTGLEPGLYQLNPVIDLAPDKVQIDTVLPETIVVLLELLPTPTPTTTPAATAFPGSPITPTP